MAMLHKNNIMENVQELMNKGWKLELTFSDNNVPSIEPPKTASCMPKNLSNKLYLQIDRWTCEKEKGEKVNLIQQRTEIGYSSSCLLIQDN